VRHSYYYLMISLIFFVVSAQDLFAEGKQPQIRVAGADQKIILLWPEGAPGAVGDTDADKPSMTCYLPPGDKANGTAVLVCPGGGYRKLSMDHEGKQVAEWLNSLGVTAFVLRYRLKPRYQFPAPFEDGKRAIRMVRARAKEWGIDPHRIGMMGFSAGGHLTSCLGVHFDHGDKDAEDLIEQTSCRPDFLIMGYPAISLTYLGEYRKEFRKPHGSLIGRNVSDEMIRKFSTDLHVTPETPPTFLVQSNNDNVTWAEHSIRFYLALRKARVPAELHVFEKSRRGHGYGLGPEEPVVSIWPKLCENWLRMRGLLKKD